MHTLHIEHAITDFTTWRAAFDRFQPARQNAGVRAHRIERPTDDERYVHIELDFDELPAAQGFLSFLEQQVWSSRDASPALAGTPMTRILQRWD